MARIPETELERLKREVSVERLALAQGVRLERRGADLHGGSDPGTWVTRVSGHMGDTRA